MTTIAIERTTNIQTTCDIAWDNVQDYTHFIHLHRRHFSSFQTLYDDGAIQVFCYAARILPPLPLLRRYVSVRILNHDDHSFKQYYRDVASGDKVYFFCAVVPDGDMVHVRNRFVFEVSGPLGKLPRLAATLINRRLSSMWHEDADLLVTRYKHGGFDNQVCAPPANQDFYTRIAEMTDESFMERFRLVDYRFSFKEGAV